MIHRRTAFAFGWASGLLLSVACLAVTTVAAQEFQVTRITVEDGLSNSSVYAILEDSPSSTVTCSKWISWAVAGRAANPNNPMSRTARKRYRRR